MIQKTLKDRFSHFTADYCVGVSSGTATYI